MIHQSLSPNGVHLQISSSMRLLVLCLVRPDLFVIYYCLLIFSKNSFLSLAPLTNATLACQSVSRVSVVVRKSVGLAIIRSQVRFPGAGVNFGRECLDRIHQVFSRTFLAFVARSCEFECNITSDWLNHMV